MARVVEPAQLKAETLKAFDDYILAAEAEAAMADTATRAVGSESLHLETASGVCNTSGETCFAAAVHTHPMRVGPAASPVRSRARGPLQSVCYIDAKLCDTGHRRLRGVRMIVLRTS